VLVRHRADPALALTLYAHLRKGSLAVSPGTQVRRGEILGQVGSSGNSTTPHLHFGFWRNVEGGGELTDPWGSRCGANRSRSYWEHDPPYLSGQANGQDDRHDGVPADQLRNTRLTVFPLTAEWN
jgi:murein DD-endopeptidase MepM/ murein hydrolase activator NlpD